MRKYAMSMTALTFLLPVFGFGQGSMGLQEKISAALQGKHRTEAELARDADRAPEGGKQGKGQPHRVRSSISLCGVRKYQTETLRLQL